MRLHWLLVLLLALVANTPSASATVATGSFTGWQDLVCTWSPLVRTAKSSYVDGRVVPARFVISLPAGSSHTARIRFDFASGTVSRFFDYLQPFNGDGHPVLPLLGVSLPSTQRVPSQWNVPPDTTLAPPNPAFAPPSGSITTYNVSSLTTDSGFVTDAGRKEIGIRFTVAGTPGSGNRTVVLVFGFHLATQADWGPGGGATQFPGACGQCFFSLNGASPLRVTVNVPAAPPSADLALSLSGPATACPRSQVEYRLDLLNRGPATSTNAVVTQWLPVGAEVLSTTASVGTVSGMGVVQWSLPNLASGASATLTVRARLAPGTGATAESSASVTATTLDGNATNNAAGVSTAVSDTDAPVFTQVPEDIAFGTDPGACGARVSFVVTASDTCDPAVTLEYSHPPGSFFPVGTTPVEVTARDASGNTASAQFQVVVTDVEPPAIAVPADYVLDLALGECALTLDYSGAPATAVDGCDGPVAVSYSPPPGTVLPPGDHAIEVTAVDAAGNLAKASFQVRVRDNPNVSWPAALPLTLVPGTPGMLQAEFSQCLNALDQSRWYRFSVRPGERVFAVLSGLSQNYDLVLFKDIGQSYEALLDESQDLPLLSAQFAADAFSPAAFSPDAFSPAAFSPAAFSPAAFSPAAFSPAAFSPAAFSPAAFSPAAFSPDIYAPAAFSPAAFSPAAFSPAAFSPAAFSPAAFSPAAFSPAAFSPAAFSEAQVRSVIAVSAFEGTANEGLVANVWNNTGDFYLRVRGRNGVFQPGAPFQVTVYVETGPCESVEPNPPADLGSGPAPESNGYRTLILTDRARLADDGSGALLDTQLTALASRPEVRGRVIDLADYPRVVWLNQQADTQFECPFAKNLLASEIREIIGQWRALNPIENIVLVGGDAVIPFFRYPDQALLGPEQNYIPPVLDFTSSQASLRLNYVLGQDAYGASCELELKLADLPLPEVPVGRLVETRSEIAGMVQAYLDVPNGVLPPPTSALVTGYDFLSDSSTEVEAELEAGMGLQIDTLIDAATVPPANGWTADQLRNALFGKRHDLIFLAGHFSAFSALAADYVTFIVASEMVASPTDFKNSILFSGGCHSGYNAVNEHGIPFVTPELDWPQAAARRQATLIAGTGYQYGDTDFIEYSERLYLRFTRELRLGTGPVSVGNALLRAKRHYLATTPVMRGIHEKSFLQATLFGLPMLQVAMPEGRIPVESDSSVVASVEPATADPGLFLGLGSADLTVVPTLTERTVTLDNIETGGTVTATYLEGASGTLVNPAEPILPLEVRNVTVGGTTLRGVGWRGGTYEDQLGIIPLTGAATTEIRGVHATFLTDVLYPVRFWSVNYFDALCGTPMEATRLYVWPAQFISANGVDAEGTLRRHTRVDFRLFYSDNREAYDLDDGSGQIVPAISSPPSIAGVFSSIEGSRVKFQVNVTGNPAAGIQGAWVTYTGVRGSFYGVWESLDLVQDATDSTLWRGELDLSGLDVDPGDVRFVVQAVNGVGLVSMHTRKGAFHVPDQNEGWETAGAVPTSVELQAPPTEVTYGERVTFEAVWASGDGSSPEGRGVVFTLGDQQVTARTDSTGKATATLNVLTVPGTYELKVSFPGGFGFAPSVDTAPVQVKPSPTRLELNPTGVSVGSDTPGTLTAALFDANGPLIERSVLFVLTGPTNLVRSVITDLTGRARLVALPPGNYRVVVHFGELVTLPDGVTTVDLRDPRYVGSQVTADIRIEPVEPPKLVVLSAMPAVLRNPNHKMRTVAVLPIFLDPLIPVDCRIIRVTSNEPENGLGDGDTAPDVEIFDRLLVRLRAERSGRGNGRIYTIYVQTTDILGIRRVDTVTVTVPK